MPSVFEAGSPSFRPTNKAVEADVSPEKPSSAAKPEAKPEEPTSSDGKFNHNIEMMWPKAFICGSVNVQADDICKKLNDMITCLGLPTQVLRLNTMERELGAGRALAHGPNTPSMVLSPLPTSLGPMTCSRQSA
ncbi:hypothetical protein PG984_014127 [Apiospora sp. TS-2023a]